MELHHGTSDAFADLDGLLARRPPQEHRELLATVAGRRVLGAHGPADGVRHGPQHAVTGGVAEAIVEDLEVVDVDHEDAQAVVGATARPLHVQGFVEVAAVGQAGQRVDLGATLGGLEGIGAGEGRGHLDGGPAQEPTVALAPGPAAASRQQQRAKEAPLGHQRRGQRVGQPVGGAHAARDLLGRRDRLIAGTSCALADTLVELAVQAWCCEPPARVAASSGTAARRPVRRPG